MNNKINFTASENLSEQIYQYLTKEIEELRFIPGEKISEVKLAGDMGVSRAPVRESLRLLEKIGLVELMPRKGCRVTNLSRKLIEWEFDILVELYSVVVRR